MNSAKQHPLDPDSGDAWVTAADGNEYWGRYGAAGLLAYDPARGILLQHRAAWTSQGLTWGLPGGARHKSEDAQTSALRETAEETGLDPATITALAEYRVDKGGWSYTTVIAQATPAACCPAPNEESLELRWVPITKVADYRLHPGFQDAWPVLKQQLEKLFPGN